MDSAKIVFLTAGCIAIAWYSLVWCLARRKRRLEDNPWENLRRLSRRRLSIRKRLKVYEWSGASVPRQVLEHADPTVLEAKMKSLRFASRLSITDFSFDDDEEEIGCAICRMPFEEQQRVCRSNNSQCQHSFHEECMADWLVKHRECPCCRGPYLKRDRIEEV